MSAVAQPYAHMIQQEKENRTLREDLTKENRELRDRIAQLEARTPATGAPAAAR